MPFSGQGFRHAGGGLTALTSTIAADTSDKNMQTLATAAGWNGTDIIRFTVTINAAVTVSASSTAIPAIKTGTFPAGCELILVNNGTIIGRGGNGGIGANSGNGAGAGNAGGTGLQATVDCSVTNNGTIAGGGGGGGGGGYNFISTGGGQDSPAVTTCVAGSGGGGGRGVSTAGAGRTVATCTNNTNGAAGTDGTISASGAGNAAGMDGGNGGNWGAAGTAGQNGNTRNGGAAGAAGKYVDGNAFVTWLTLGTVVGGTA